MSDSFNPAMSATPDLCAVISRLFVYPVKSCAAVEVQEALLTESGLEFDRAWMVVDERGEFLTQRELPRMALIKPQLKHYEMVLRAPGMLALHIKLNEVEEPVRVRVWDDEVKAYDMGAIAAQWFTDFLGTTARLVRFDPDEKRLSDSEWTGGIEAQNQFSDGYPLLVVSEASLGGLNDKLVSAGFDEVSILRFRPNIVIGDDLAFDAVAPHDEDRLDEVQISTEQGAVRLKPVKPCPRCPIPNVDPATAVVSPQVNDMLQTYRQNAKLNGALTFGMNLIVLEGGNEGNEHVLKVGQTVTAGYRFN